MESRYLWGGALLLVVFGFGFLLGDASDWTTRITQHEQAKLEGSMLEENMFRFVEAAIDRGMEMSDSSEFIDDTPMSFAYRAGMVHAIRIVNDDILDCMRTNELRESFRIEKIDFPVQRESVYRAVDPTCHEDHRA